MALTFITVTADFTTAGGHTTTSPVPGTVTFTPSSQLIDSAGSLIMPAVGVTMTLAAGAGAIKLLCTDNAAVQPSGWYWVVAQNVGTTTYTYSVFLPSTLGASVDLSQVAPATPGPPVYGYYGVLAAPNVNDWTSTQDFNGPVAINDGLSIASVTIQNPPGGTTDFLRADGTWASPAASAVTSVFGRTGAVVAQSGDYSFNQLSGTATIAEGGTGQTTQQAAIDALTGTQSAGTYLRSDGTNATLSTIHAGDVPTLNQSTTGTAANVTGTVAIANGGTGQTSQQAALNALAGATTSAEFLRGNGTNVLLASIQASDVPTLNQNTTGTASNVTGTVAIANGGSGHTTQQAAINALTGTQSAGTFLRSDGTNATLSAIQASDVPTLNQNTTGTAGNVTGTVAIANGGTGQVTQQAALNALAGAQTSGDFLRGNGTNVLMAPIQVSDVPTLNQSTTGTASNVTGIVAVVNGGTGQTTLGAAGILLAGNNLSDVSSAATSFGNLKQNATTGATGVIQLAGDLANTATSPQVVSTHLSSALPLAQGGTASTTAQGAMNTLAGGVTSGDYLRGNGTNVVLSTIQTADLPSATTGAKGIIQLDGTAADIQPLGVQSAGSNGLAADSGHVHPTTGVMTTFNQSAFRLGLVSETMPVYSGNSSNTLTSGTLFLMLLAWPANKTLTHVSVYVTTLGVTSSGTNNIGLYSSSGTLLTTTGDMTTGFETLGFQEGTLAAPQTPTVDTVYYVGVLSHFSATAMHIWGYNMVATIGAFNGAYPAITFASQTNQGSFTPSSGTVNSGAYWIGAR